MSTTRPDTAAPATPTRPSAALGGLLSGLVAGRVQGRGHFEALGLFRADGRPDRGAFASPLEALKLVRVPTYGTMVLHDTAPAGRMIVPMHVGFFQEGAQNHATSRVLILEAGETLEADDCFCIQ